jgi:hypothetical protein
VWCARRIAVASAVLFALGACGDESPDGATARDADTRDAALRHAGARDAAGIAVDATGIDAIGRTPDSGTPRCMPAPDTATCTIFVDPSGSDSATGTSADPFATPQHALSAAEPGDTICLRSGVYTGTIRVSRSGAEGAPITIRNEPGQRPVVEPGPDAGDKGVLLQARGGENFPIGWIVIEGLELRNGHDGIKFYSTHDVIIRHNHIHDNRSQGILGTGLRILIDGNRIEENGGTTSSLQHGMYLNGNEYTIVNNVIWGNSAYGIQMAGYPYNPDTDAGPEYGGAARWVVSNNTFGPSFTRPGMVIWKPASIGALVQNNIFYMNTGAAAIDFLSGGGEHVFRNNLVFGTALTNGDAALYEESGTLELDPAFADVGAGDYHLEPSSPALDAGAAERAPDHDFDGVGRPQGAGIDLGAFERCPD